MMSDERRRRRSPESSRRSRRKARRDDREYPETTLYSYPSQSQAQAQEQSQWASSSFQQTTESPLPPIKMRSNDDARTSTTAVPMSVPIPTDLNRPQRRRRSRHGSGSSSDFTYSSSGSSSSYLDISRWYPSYGRAGGVLKAFFKTPSEHKPRRRRSRKQIKTKKTKAIFGFGNNSSSSSVNSDMAYGMGFLKKPKSRGGDFSPGYNNAGVAAMGREASGSRPGMQRRQTDEEILEIGRKLAQVAREQNQEDLRRMGKKPPSQFVAAMNSWDRYRQSTGEQSTSGRGIAPSRSDRHHGYSSDDESEWESASEDEDSDASSGLAYGFHHASTPKLAAARTSRPSTAIASAVPEERRGLARKSSIVDPKLFGPVNSLRDFVNTPCGFDDDRGTYPDAGPGQERHTGSAGTAESASFEARPLQTVYPIGTSDPGKMDAARDSGSIITIQQNNYATATPRDRVYSTVSNPNDRPEPLPIQAPKPIAPVPSRLYDEQRVHDPERFDSRERRRRSGEYRRDRSDSRGRRHQSGDYETGRSDSRERRRNPGDSKIFAETALVGAGVAALGAAIMAKRDKGKGKEPELSHGRDERYGHDDHRQDDTKVQDSRRAKELALEKEIERLEKVLAERNKARETRRRDSKRNSAPADLEKDYDGERERRRSARSSRHGGTDSNVQPEPSNEVSGPRGDVDVFQYQVSDDAFNNGTTPREAPLPVIIDVTPSPSPAPEQSRKSRRDSFEDEMRDARHIVEEASHSTAPIPEVAMAAAIAATEHSRRHEELEDEGRGRKSKADRDRVQEEANRYYHARRIAEREIRSRSRSRSSGGEGGPPRIVTPPEMKERPKVYDYSKPNADIIFDNELSPIELRSFFPKMAPVRDPSAERPRPVLNLILPTPVPTPSPEKEEQRRKSASRAQEEFEEEPAKESPKVLIGPKGNVVQIVDAPEPREEIPQPPTPKSVSWGPSETKQYEVDSPERSRERTPESPERVSRSGKKSSGGWGAIAAALAGATAGAAIASDHDGKRSEGSRSPPKERPILPAGTSSRVMEEEPEELPPLPGPKPASPRNSQMPGAFADDLEFTANVAAGLEHAGFPSDIVVEDPNFRRRDSPPGSNEPFTGVYSQPYSETVSDLGIMGHDDGSRPVREPGYVLGELADTPASEKEAAFDEPTIEHGAFETPKLSKKEQRKLEKAAKAAKLAEEQQAVKPIEAYEDDWADTSSSKKPKKSKRSKRSSVSWDDEDTPVNDTHVSVPIETFADFQEPKPSKDDDDDWDIPKKSKKSKRSSKSYNPGSEDSPERRDHRREAYEALEGDVASIVSDSRHDTRSKDYGRDDDRSVVSAPSGSDRKRDSKSDKRSSGSGFWGLLKGSNGVDTNDKKESKKDNAGTLGAGAGLAGVAVAAAALAGGMAAARSDAAEAPSGQEEPHVGRDVDESAGRADSSSREVDVFEDPEIVPRVIKPAIDPQYGDLLPLPPSPGEKTSLEFEGDEDLPALPDSRPSTPPGQERVFPRERSASGQKRPGLIGHGHSRRLSNYEAPLRSPSHTAIPIQFRMGQRPASVISPAGGRPAGSGSPAMGRSSPTPQSPATSSGQEFSPTFTRSPRPTSWDNSKEFKPLYLLEQAGRPARDAQEDLSESPEMTPLPPSRGSPAPETELEIVEREIVPPVEDAPLHVDTEAAQVVPSRSQESTPKGTPAAEYNVPLPGEDAELTPFETPYEAPFGVPSASSLPESSYATPVESPSQVIEKAPVSGRQEPQQPVDVLDRGSQGSGRDLQEPAQPRETVQEERQPADVPEVQQKKSYFPSAFSILPAATLAGVGAALLGRGKRSEAVQGPAEHTTKTDSEEPTEHFPATANQVSLKDAQEAELGDQSGSTEQGAAGARKSPTDTTYSSTTNTADASMPNDPAASMPTRPDEPLVIDDSRPSEAVTHDVVENDHEPQIPAVAGTPDALLPSSLPRDIETDLKTTTPTEPEQNAEDMETIIETPADTIDWPMETVPKKKKGKKGKKKQSVSDVPQIPMDAGSTTPSPVDVPEDISAPEVQTAKAIDEPVVGAELAGHANVIQSEAVPAQVASAPEAVGAEATDIRNFENVPGSSFLLESIKERGLVGDPEEIQPSVEAEAIPSMKDDQGVVAGDRPLKSSSGRRLRSSRVMSPHGSVDEYMSSDAVQSGEDAPMSPASGLRTTGKKYKKTRSLRSSRRSSAASQGSGQGDVAAEQPASGDAGTVPDVERFRDAAEEPIIPMSEVVDQPADAEVQDVDQFLSKDTENVEEPAMREAGSSPEPFQTETETKLEASSDSIVPVEAQPLQDIEVAAEPVAQPETPIDDEWAPTSSKKSKKNKKKKKTQSFSLAEDPWDAPAPEPADEKAVPAAADPVAPQEESTLVTPQDHDQAHDLASEQGVGDERSKFQQELVEATASTFDSEKPAEDVMHPQSQDETPLTAEKLTALPHSSTEPQELLQSFEDEPALAKEEVLEEPPTIQSTVNEQPIIASEDLPNTQEPESRLTAMSLEEEFPVVSSKKSKKNKKKRKGSAVLDETVQSPGTATPVELEQTGQGEEVQETSRLPAREENLLPASESPGDVITAKEESQAVEIGDVRQDDELPLVGEREPTEPILEAPVVQEQSEPTETLQTKDVPLEPVLEPQSAEVEYAQTGANISDPARDLPNVLEASVPIVPEATENDLVHEPALKPQSVGSDAKPTSQDSVTEQATAIESDKSVEPQTVEEGTARSVDPVESIEALSKTVPEEETVEPVLLEKLQETETPAQEESSKVDDEDILRREAEAAQAEEEEAEIARLQGKKKLKSKEKQRLRELKAKSEARAAEAEATAMASAEEKASVEGTTEAEVAALPSDKGNFPDENLPETEIREDPIAEAATDRQPTEETAPIATEESPAVAQNLPESAALTTQHSDPTTDAILEGVDPSFPEQRAEAEPVPEAAIDAAEDPEEIARREAEAEVICQEESELARLKNKKKPSKKDKERMRVLRASVELRERGAEALQRQIEEQEAAAAAQEAPESTKAGAEAESSEKPAADETSEAVPLEDPSSAELEESTKPEVEMPVLSRPEEQLPRELDNANQKHIEASTYLQPEDKIAADLEDTTEAEAEEAAPGHTDIHTLEDSVDASQTVAEESIPLSEYATGDVQDPSLHSQPESHVPQDVAVQEVTDLPGPLLEQDESHLPDLADNTVQQTSEADIVQDDVSQRLPEEVALPEYELGEAREVGDKPEETEMVAAQDELPPTKPDESQIFSEHNMEQPKEEVTQSQSEQTIGPPLESQTKEIVPEPLSKAIPTSSIEDEEAHIATLEKTPAADAVPPEPETEPEPVFTTKKSKKDKKKKRKGTISEDSGQSSGIVTPAEMSEPAAVAEALPTGEPVAQSATDEVSFPADKDLAPSEQVEPKAAELLELATVPSTSEKEPPLPEGDEAISVVQEGRILPSEDQPAQIPATLEDEALPTAKPEAQQEDSPREPEFTVSTKKSKKDKKKKRKGTISESSPQASGSATPTDTGEPLQEPTPEVLDRSENPASTAEPESVPAAPVDAPEQEQIQAQEEPSNVLTEAEAATATEIPEDPNAEDLQDSNGEDKQVPITAEDTSLMPTHEQPNVTAQTVENVAVEEPQPLETEQANLEQEQIEPPTILEDAEPAVPITAAESKAVEPPEDLAVQAKETSAELELEEESIPTVSAEPEEVQADDFFVVPTKKSKKDKKKKRASAAWSEPESGAQTPVVEDPIEPISRDTTETTTVIQDFPTTSSDLPQDEPAKDPQAPSDDWAPTTSSKKTKKDKKKKKRASVLSWEPESGAQTPLNEEPQELQDAPEPTIEPAEQKEADFVAQPTETLAHEPEMTSTRDVADVHESTLPATAEESSDMPSEAPTTFVKPDSTIKKSSGGWGLIAAALGGESSGSKEMSHSTNPAEPLEPETEPVVPPTEDLAIDYTPVTAEDKKDEPQPIESFDEPKTSSMKSMGGWGTIAAAVAGVTAGATAMSAEQHKRETSPQRVLEDVASTSEAMTKPDLKSKVDEGDETLIIAGGERVVAHDDPADAPIPKPDLEDKVDDGEDTLIVAGGKTAQEDTEPWSFEAARDIQTEPLTKHELDEKVDNSDDTVIVAGGQISEEPAQVGSDTVDDSANNFLDTERSAMRPSSPVPWEDEDRMNEFATPSEQPPILGEEAEAAPLSPPRQAEPDPFEFVTGKKPKKDKKKKKSNSISQSLEVESEMPTPMTETPQFEEALEQQQPSASMETPGLAEPVDSNESKPADEEAEALDWIPKKMSKKEKRKAKKGGSLSISEPEPIAAMSDNSQHPAEFVTSPQDIAESRDLPSISRDNHDVLVDEAQQELPLTEESKTTVEPVDEKVHSLDAEASSIPQPEPEDQEQSEDAVVRSAVAEPEANLSVEPELASQHEPVLEEAPVLTRKMSKKEKRKAKKQAAFSWEDDVLEPSETTATATAAATEDTQTLENPVLTEQPEPISQAADIESSEPVAPVAEETVAEDEWAPLSRKKSKKDKKKGKQRVSEPDPGAQTPVKEEPPISTFPEISKTSPIETPAPEVVAPREDDHHPSVEDTGELATEPSIPSISFEHEHIDPPAEKLQPEHFKDASYDDWEEAPERSEPTKVGLGSPAALGAELQKIPSAAPSPDIWDNEDYFKPKGPNESRNSPNEKPIEKVDIHPAFSRELGASPENRSKDERPLVGLGLIHRHSSIFQDDDGHTPKLLTLDAGNFSVESLALEDTASADDSSQTGMFKAIGKEPLPRSGKTLLEQRATPAPEDNVQYVNAPVPDDRQPTPTDSSTPRAPKPPPSPGLDDVNKMSKKGSVAMLAERFGGTKKAPGKRKKVSKYVDKRTPQDDLFDEPSMWEGSERKPVEGSRLDLDAGDFWAVPDTELDETSAEPDTFAGQEATTSCGQEIKTGDDNVSATHSPTSQEAGTFTPQVSEQASRAEEVPLESLVVESPVLGSQASFELSPREEDSAIEPLDRPPDIDTGQPAALPTTVAGLSPGEAGKERHGLHTPRSLSPASDRGVRLDRSVSPSSEADDYAMQQGISPVSDFRRPVSRGLPPVQEEPHEEDGEADKHGISVAEIGDVNRDSGFVTGSPLPPVSRQFDDFQQRDSGVHLRDYPSLSADPNRVSQSSLESEGAKLDDKPRRSPLAESPKRRQLSESTPVLEAQESPVTPEPQKSKNTTRRSRKQYPDLGPEAAAASLAGGAALLKATSPTPSMSSAASRRSFSDRVEKNQPVSNTGISRSRTPEPLNLRPESPSLLRYSGTPPLRSRRTRSGDLRSLSQLSNRSHSDTSAILQASPSPASGAVDPASAPSAANPLGPASFSSSSDLRKPTATTTSSNTNPTSHTPLANEGRVRSKDMADVYDGFGEGRLGSPRSPTRPHSMRRRQSMQVLELESRVEQLLAENRSLSEARLHAEQHNTNRATSTIAERDNEIESLKQSLDFMRKEIQRLTEVNEGLNSAIAQSAVQHEDRYRILETQHSDATRELNLFRGRHSSSSRTIEEKDAEIRDLREQLEATKEQIRDMQRQILASKPADSDFLRIKDVDYFDHRCQQLCSHVQQWVLRFSKFSDMRACRLTSELNDEKIIDRLDNAVLDGSNVDNYLNDRVRRRDVFMSLAMTMIWEFVFTRYLFGMDREQRQKLKALEKLLLEVGPPHAVRQWRAVTLTLLSRRESFKTQRDQDTEAVVQAVFQTLCMILPPPSNLEDQIQNQLRKVMREAVDLSVEMRTQRAEYMMLPPLQPEYDANGDLAEPHPFNATLMNERSGDRSVDNDDLQAQGSIVRVVLFPLVVKKGDDDGVGDDEVVVCPAQVIVARPRSSSRRSMRAPSSDAGGVSLLRGGSPSTAPNRSNVSMAEAEYLEGGI